MELRTIRINGRRRRGMLGIISSVRVDYVGVLGKLTHAEAIRRRTALLFEADRSPGQRAAQKFDQRMLFSLALALAADKAALASQLY
jgi:hypothetical protein